jgi:PAS domain S-box-containing protein
MLYWGDPRTLSDHELDLALSLTSFVAHALERAASHEQLRRAEAKLSIALDAARMGVWVWEATTGRVTWSPTLEEIHGLSPGTFEGTFDAYQRDVHPEDKERVLETIRETYENQRDHELEYRIVRPDGEVRWLAARGKVFSDTDGQSTGMTGICMDVTERKHAEHVREAAVIELERAVRFNEMFTGVLGHDLRNPLNAVKLAARVALSQDEGEKLVKPLSRILRSSERMTRMIDQLLDLTRLRLGSGIPLEPRPVELVPVLCQVIDELDDAHPRGSLRLAHDGDSHGRWDADRLAQVFSNLVANALQHGVPERGVEVRVDGRAADRLSIEVHNMGIIPASLIPKLFEPLVGGDRKPNGAQGLGLGLFISRAIVTAHGGSIEVRSDERSGTTFRVVLPRG